MNVSLIPYKSYEYNLCDRAYLLKVNSIVTRDSIDINTIRMIITTLNSSLEANYNQIGYPTLLVHRIET